MEQPIRVPLCPMLGPHKSSLDPNRRFSLRLVMYRPTFVEHASMHFLIPLLGNHDHSQFEIVCYAEASNPDGLTARRNYADRWWSTVGVSDDQLADQVREDEIDILVDLKLHTLGQPAIGVWRKPAPVQFSWLGYPGSSGVETIVLRRGRSISLRRRIDLATWARRQVLTEGTVNGKAVAWRRCIDDQRASGQSVRAWCKGNDALSRFLLRWRARLGLSPGKRRLRRSLKLAEAKPTPLAFAQVVVHPSTAEPLRLRFAPGMN